MNDGFRIIKRQSNKQTGQTNSFGDSIIRDKRNETIIKYSFNNFTMESLILAQDER